MESLDKQIRKVGLNNGLILGIIVLILGIFAFYFMTQMTTSFWMVVLVGPVLFSLLIPILILIFYCIDFRKKIGGYWTFKQAFTGIFIMLLVAYVVTAIGRDLVFAKLVEFIQGIAMFHQIIKEMADAVTTFFAGEDERQST